MKRRTIKVVDVNEVIKPQKVEYNESVMSIYHDKTYTPQTKEEEKNWMGYWPVDRKSKFARINEAHYQRLKKALE